MTNRSNEALLDRRAKAKAAKRGEWEERRKRFYGDDEETSYVAVGRRIILLANPRTDAHNTTFCAANDPKTVIADIDEILRLRSEVERLKEENEAHRVVTANFKRITENLTGEIDDNEQEVEEHIAHLEAQIDFLAKTCARQSHDAPDKEAVNWWRAKAREAAEKKA